MNFNTFHCRLFVEPIKVLLGRQNPPLKELDLGCSEILSLHAADFLSVSKYILEPFEERLEFWNIQFCLFSIPELFSSATPQAVGICLGQTGPQPLCAELDRVDPFREMQRPSVSVAGLRHYVR